MKNLKSITALLFIALITLFLSSCSDDNESVEDTTISEEEAVDIIDDTLDEETGGLNELIQSFVEELLTDIVNNDVCGTLYQSSYPFDYSGDLVTADYDVAWNYELFCDTYNIPESVSFNAISTGNYDSVRIDSNDNSDLNVTIAGLSPLDSYLTLNGNFTRDGSQQLTTVLNTRNLTSTLNLDLTNVLIDSTSYQITSGTGNFTFSYTNLNNTYSYTGNMVFNGNGSITIIINGLTYTIDLN
ncbi:hypothetical protein [Mesoflavibacter sp. CH_XMU1404-2]|uniref:hypothetical protein n=1 Tax=Mesoflavibacter sp. CH_XMU1404-2 TaxID=3107766 RepID=UPI00300B0481